jgi:hypothetical protein
MALFSLASFSKRQRHSDNITPPPAALHLIFIDYFSISI